MTAIGRRGLALTALALAILPCAYWGYALWTALDIQEGVDKQWPAAASANDTARMADYTAISDEAGRQAQTAIFWLLVPAALLIVAATAWWIYRAYRPKAAWSRRAHGDG